MFIEEYFEQIRKAISACTAVESFQLTEAKRDSYTGFLRGRVYFHDDSLLHVREFVYVITEIERDMYSYHYVDSSGNLIFRYDNAEHKPQLNLPNLPHHKHEESEQNIVASAAPTLAEVLQEVESVNFRSR